MKKFDKNQISLSILFFPLFIVLLVSSSQGATYYYKNKNGVHVYTNIPPVEKGYKRIILYEQTCRKSSKSSGSFRPFTYSKEYDQDILKTARWYGVDPYLVKAIIKVESNFDPKAVSPKGAMGVMQLMPETAKDHGVIEPFDPSENIRGGVRYLKKLMDMFSGNLQLALAGYNAGENAVIKYGYAVPPYAETLDYVEKVLTHYNYLKNKPIGERDKKVVEIKEKVMQAGPINLTAVDSSGRFTIQIASFSEVEQAEEMKEALKSKGYPAFIQRVDLPGKGTWYRVRVGTFSTKEEAKQYGDTIKSIVPSIKSVFVAHLL
jgi:soluble lytic murein transglycosylase